MANRNEPQVVYCDRGHIYDKSLSAECPYCNKSKKRKELFPGLSNFFSRKEGPSNPADSDITVQIDDDITEVADDATEMADDATEMADDATEMADDSTEMADVIQQDLPIMPVLNTGNKGFGMAPSAPVSLDNIMQNSETAPKTFSGFSWGNDYEFEIDIPRAVKTNTIPEPPKETVYENEVIDENDVVDESEVTDENEVVDESEVTDENEVVEENEAIDENEVTYIAPEQEIVSETEEDYDQQANEIEVEPKDNEIQARTITERTANTRSGYVLGWLVVTMGLDRGRSLEICEGNNYISFDDKGHMFITDSEDPLRSPCANVSYQDDENEFCINRMDEEDIYINDGLLQETDVLENGDIVSFDQAEVQFYALLGLEGFDWRQI